MVRKFILLVIPASIIVTLLVSGVLLYVDYENSLGSINRSLNTIKVTHSETLGSAIWEEDHDQIQAILSGMIKGDHIKYASIKNADGDFSLSVGEKPESLDFISSFELKKEVDDDTFLLGKVEIIAVKDDVFRNLKKQIISLFSIQLIQAIVLGVIIFFIFQNLVAKHLNKMAIYCSNLDLEEFSEGDLKLDRSDSSKDELEDVVSAFNNIRERIKSSHVALKDFAENLENKVVERTNEIEVEKRKVDNLLHNIQQAIFAIDMEGVIIGPTSAFSKEVFGYEIEGKSVWDTIYKDLNKKEESYSLLNTALILVFAGDQLQYEASEQYLPRRVIYHFPQKEEKEDELTLTEIDKRIFSVSYYPIFNGNELEQLMLVVEDITELERLTIQMESEKKASEKNIQIIREIGLNEIEEVEDFFSSAPGFVSQSLENSEDLSDLEALRETFRLLHTLKGNARFFNFSGISNTTHEAESYIKTALEKAEEGEKVDDELKKKLFYQLFEINSEIYEYTKLGKNVFRIENQFENNLIKDAHEKILALEGTIDKIVENKGNFDIKKEKEEFHYKFISNKNINQDLPEMISAAQGLRGVVHSLNNKDILPIFDDFIDALVEMKVPRGRMRMRVYAFHSRVIKNFVQLRNITKDLYKNSNLFDAYKIKISDWVIVFHDLYFLSSYFGTEENLERFSEKENNLVQKIAGDIITKVAETKFIYLHKLFLEFSKIFTKDHTEVKDHWEEINNNLSCAWRYLSLLCRLELNGNKEKREHIKEVLGSLPNDVTESSKILEVDRKAQSLIFSAFKKMAREQIHPREFLKMAGSFLGGDFIRDPLSSFAFQGEGSNYLENFWKSLSSFYVDLELPLDLQMAVEENDPIAQSIISFFKSPSTPSFTYLKVLDLSLLFGKVHELEDQDLNLIEKNQMLQVVSSNYNKLLNEIEALNSDEKEKIGKVLKAFSKLLDVPLMTSLAKFKPMVLDLSQRLSKKVKLEIKGKEYTLNRDHFYLIQDAIVHILRNSVDHGIETIDERSELGKDPVGKIQILCKDHDGQTAISIRDDGKGIDPDGVLKKALSKSLITEEESKSLGLDEKINLIFKPNFSTKETVTDLSGRGVGMDIVKTNIEKMGGTLTINTIIGKGTEFLITLPS